MPDLRTGVLYYGDNLDVLRKYVPDASVDLVYLDPPFNSSRSYNVLFRESGGASSEAQIEAFEDTWEWGPAAARAYDEVITGPHQPVARMLRAMVEGLGRNPVTAYLCMMAPRLVELHRVLKPTGSLYLHCDPTAGPYLRVLLDSVFGPTNFRSEIVWRRSNAHSKLSRQFGPIHDTLWFFSRSDAAVLHPGFRPHYRKYIAEQFTHHDENGPYRLNEITGSGIRFGASGQPWRGINITAKGRHWAIPASLTSELGLDDLSLHERLDALAELGDIVFTASGFPRYKQRQTPGVPFQDIWAYQPYTNGLLEGTEEGIDQDVKWLEDEPERLGYQTQKPLGLLERIISASSNPGDVVLDPFCGCGTAVHTAEKLGRRWIGIDITYLAIGLIRRRMQDAFPSTGSGRARGLQIEEIGAPVDLNGAKALAEHDKYQFQWWALDRLGAQPVSGRKKGADQGIDGVILFPVGGTAERPQYGRAIVSVKGGGVTVKDIRDLVGVLDREKEPLGVLMTLEPPTGPMRREAASAGIYHSEFWQKDYPRVQIITIEELLHGKLPEMPPSTSPFAQAPRERPRGKQLKLG